MFTSEKREMRARRGGRAKSSQAYPKIRRELFESPTKSGDADSASQRKDTNELLSNDYQALLVWVRKRISNPSG